MRADRPESTDYSSDYFTGKMILTRKTHWSQDGHSAVRLSLVLCTAPGALDGARDGPARSAARSAELAREHAGVEDHSVRGARLASLPLQRDLLPQRLHVPPPRPDGERAGKDAGVARDLCDVSKWRAEGAAHNVEPGRSLAVLVRAAIVRRHARHATHTRTLPPVRSLARTRVLSQTSRLRGGRSGTRRGWCRSRRAGTS